MKEKFFIVSVRCLTAKGLKRRKRLEKESDENELMGRKPIDLDDESNYDEGDFEYRRGAIRESEVVAMYPSADGEHLFVDTRTRDYTILAQLEDLFNLDQLEGQETSIPDKNQKLGSLFIAEDKDE
jgi:hypothetical protein